MQIEVSEKGRFTILTVIQEFDESVDLEYFDSYLKILLEKEKRYIGIKFSENSHLYSGAISILIKYKKELTKLGGDICIVEPSDIILETFKMLNLDEQFDIFSSAEDLPG